MADIATNLARIIAAKADIKSAIEAKGVSVPDAAKIDAYDDYVAAISTGGGEPVVYKNVNFYDYDGELLYSYTDVEFLALDAMPSNPSHTGLTAQGWNWSLANAKTYVATYRYLEIGQQYVTDDGKTRIYITIPANSEYMTFSFNIVRSQDMVNASTNDVVINWGDGSAGEAFVKSKGAKILTHTYAASGDYMITLYSGGAEYHIGGPGSNNTSSTSVRGQSYWSIFGDIYYDSVPVKVATQLSYVTKVEIGTGVTATAILATSNLETVTINKNLTHVQPTPATNNALRAVSKLKAFIYPQSITYFRGLSSMGEITFLDLKCICFCDGTPTDYVKNAYAYSCKQLKHLTLPEWSYDNDRRVSNNDKLEVLIYPDTWTTQGNNLVNSGVNSNLKYVHLPNALTTVTALRNCYRLKSFTIPNTLTAIPSNAFDYMQSIESLTIPEGIQTIGSSGFAYAFSLRELILPSTLTTISGSAFAIGTSLGLTITINATTPPTVSSNSFTIDVRHPAVIRVPVGKLSTYQNASGWTTWSSYMVEQS